MGRPREFDEKAVVEAARQRFWATGYAGTSVSDLTEATGLGKGSLYGAFGDKHRLFVRIFDEYCEAAVRDAGTTLAGPDDGALQRLTDYLHNAADSSAGEPRRGCLLAKGTAELADSDAEIAADALMAYQGIEDALARALEQARRHGDLAAETDPRRQARLLIAVLRGMETLGKAGYDAAALHDSADAALGLLARA